MRETAKALKTFFSSFSLPAYDEYSVPDDVDLPYITYNLAEPEWDQNATMYAQIWYRTKSNTEVLTKADEIVQAIGNGTTIKLNGGLLVIWPETPLVQIIVDDDVRRAYINLSIRSVHLPGV